MNIFTFTKLARVMLLSAVLAVAALVGTAAAQQKGTFKDSRDGKTYKTVVIGGKKWMAENLNYKTGNSWCYDDDDSNCKKYGRLYDWKTARTACPRGWHLPSDDESQQLTEAADTKDAVRFGGTAGKRLKSTYGWDKRSNGNDGNGTDEFGFSALPGGLRTKEGAFEDAGKGGAWWTSRFFDHDSARNYKIYGEDQKDDSFQYHDYGLSVRCVKDVRQFGE